MKNPLDQFRSGLFGSRGCDIAAALQYVDELAAASSDAVAVQTAARVLLNTAANAVHQVMSAPSPEKLALIELIDARIAEKLDNVDQQIEEWFNDNIDIEDKVNDWMSNNFDVNDYNLSDAVNDWMNDNLADKINDIDLVVRVR